MHSTFRCGRYSLPLNGPRPLIMGILNITPDSFSDGGRYHHRDAALKHAEHMMHAGVDIIDIGGQSSRPGSQAVGFTEECDRVLPVLEALYDCGKPLSIDTTTPPLMREALKGGADMINDIQGFRAEGALQAVCDFPCGLCVMHMQGEPQTMQRHPIYADVCQDVTEFLRQRVALLEAAGIARERLSIDPGFGFGKTLEHNLALFKHIPTLSATLGLPLLVGVSRKSMLGALTGQPIHQRMPASITAAMLATLYGAHIVRVHDVEETRDACKVWERLCPPENRTLLPGLS